MSQATANAIVKTLAYADLFDYPLSEQEIFKFLISDQPVAHTKVQNTLSKSLRKIILKNGFYCLKGREKLIILRKKRQKWSQEKVKIAQKLAKWLRLIPWIKMVGVTGALAMNNAQKDDDIDFLIVTAKNRLWLTRLLTVFLVSLLAKRRQPGDTKVKDKICLNMFLDEAHLRVPKKEQDLFSAHEVCQLKPILDKDQSYQRFINLNQWVMRFLPNWKP
jgi:hypothetical protein